MKYRIWWLIAAGALLMGLGLIGARAVFEAGSAGIPQGFDLITVTAGAAQEPAGPTPDELNEMEALLEGSHLSWWAKGRGTIGTDERNTVADVYATDGAFQDFHHMDMLYGSFLPRTGAGGLAAVLDNKLAYRLFGTENAVGLELSYNGKTFQVCGVCRADDSILGLMSGSGTFRAYVSGNDLVATGAMGIGGVEALLPQGAPGENVAKVKTVMQEQGLSASAYLVKDDSEQGRLDAEASLLPMAALAVSSMAILLAFLLRAAKGITMESAAILKGGYFSDVWGALLWRLSKLLLAVMAAVGITWLMWESIGLDICLPAKYIPGSWIDISFYTGLIQSESQAAIDAASYPSQWWDTAAKAALSISRGLNTAAIIGAIVTALSLRALWADRRHAAAAQPRASVPGLWDVPALWALALLSFAAALLLAVAAGLPVHTGLDALAVLAITLMVWAMAMHREKVERWLYKSPLSPVGDISP